MRECCGKLWERIPPQALLSQLLLCHRILPAFLLSLLCFSPHHLPCISPLYTAHKLRFLKQTSNFVMFQVQNLLGHAFLPWIKSRFFHLWFRSLTVRTQSHLSTPIYHSSHLGTFNFQSCWTYYCMKDTSFFSLLSSVYAFPLSETIFFHHSYIVIANVKLCQMTPTLTPLPPTSTPTSQSQMGSRTMFINLPWHFSMSCIRIIFVFV